jgi:hypothetical protein
VIVELSTKTEDIILKECDAKTCTIKEMEQILRQKLDEREE